jgi:hypothetical protein
LKEREALQREMDHFPKKVGDENKEIQELALPF